MGYCISQEDASFFIAKDDVPKALEAVRSLNDRTDFLLPTFAAIMDEWRWVVTSDSEGNIVAISFEGEKAGDEEVLFYAIAPFVRNGSFIEMSGEDHARWRWVFNDGQLKEVYAKLVW